MDRIQWEISVPIFRNSVILKQLGIALGISFGLVAVIIWLISGEIIYSLYFLCLVAGLLFLTWLFILAVYGGKYDVEFELDSKGALSRTQSKQARKNRIINGLTIFLGMLSDKPSAVGAGKLAQSRQEVFLKWSKITKVKYKPRSFTILLRGGWTENIALFCSSENYYQIEQEVILRTKHLKT